MNLADVFGDASLKSKARVARIGNGLLDGHLSTGELLDFARNQEDVRRATCIEALEYATRKEPGLADREVMDFVTEALDEPEPRIKWESARVVANIAGQHPDELQPAIKALLRNASHEGTVVRWATGLAFGTIVTIQTVDRAALQPTLQAIAEKEADPGVRKKFVEAAKRAGKT